MNEGEIKSILEALLLSAEQPLSLDQLLEIFNEENIERGHLQNLINELAHDYQPRAIELSEVASGFCIQTKAKYKHWIGRLQAEKAPKYSRALLETLAIIAYRQPVTRADIENIRGVAVNTVMLKTLMEREWIKIAGHRDVPGKPAVYVTTKQFLDYFNLKNLNQLPPIENSNELLSLAPEEFIEEYV